MLMTLFALIACSEKPIDDTAEEIEDTSSESDTEQLTDTGETNSNDTGPSEDTQDTNDTQDTQDTDEPNDTQEDPEPNPVYIGGYNTNVCFPKASPTGYGIGNVSHDFTLTDQHGEQVSLSDF